MHRTQLPFDKRRHLPNRDVWLGECPFLVAVAAVLATDAAIRIGAAAEPISAQRHSAALARWSSLPEHDRPLLLRARSGRIERKN